LDIAQVDVEAIRKRAAQLELERMQRQDADQRMTDTSRINHAEKIEPSEEAWKSQYRAMREKAHRLDISGAGTQCL
jgi:hypothetical protein